MFALENLTKQSTKSCEPWKFMCPAVPDETRFNKVKRQAWYQNPETVHQFYSCYEGLNPNARVTVENPALFMLGAVVDLDGIISDEKLDDIILKAKVEPNWVERSLGGGARLLWVFTEKVRFPQTPEVANEVLDALQEYLGMKDIGALDQGSWDTPHRYYANGVQWRQLNKLSLAARGVNNIIRTVVLNRAKKNKTQDISLERVLELVKAKWPDWDWPGDFKSGAQGPSWWVEGSVSLKSAIVHDWGMYTFSAHAEKESWTWNELLGPGALEADQQNRIEASVKDIYYDGLTYFNPNHMLPGFKTEGEGPLRRFLSVTCGLGNVRKKGKPSEVDLALTYIEQNNRVIGAAPFVHRPAGAVVQEGHTFLNTLEVWPIPAHPDPQVWGPEGGFPFISEWFGLIFRSDDQLTHFLSWFASAYRSGVDGKPHQGQAIFLNGGQNIGKTLASKRIIGAILGGSTDASDFLRGADTFGGELFKSPVWCVDDQIMSTSNQSLRLFTQGVKRIVANRSHTLHEKYRMKTTVEWMGRAVITANLDANSQTVLPALEESVADKVNFYRLLDGVTEKLPDNFFPEDVEGVIKKELAYFARYLYDFTIPDRFRGDSRYRVQSYQDKELVDTANTNSGSAGHHELVSLFLDYHINTSDDGATAWVGSVSELLGMMNADPRLSHLAKSITATQMNRHLSTLQSYPSLEITSIINQHKLKIWTIRRKEINENDQGN